jgi:hypothetical protein
VAVEGLESGGDAGGVLVEQAREGWEGRALHGEGEVSVAAAAEEEDGGGGEG